MVLLTLSANHHDLDLADIDRLSAGASELGARVVAHSPAVRGAVVLATCNRFELYLETDDADGGESAATTAAYRAVATASGTPEDEVARLMRPIGGDQAAAHLFEVAAGLDSMVVGEREIAGQVRRALSRARQEGTTTPLLERTLQFAARTSRQVAVETDLARAGRSVVAVALDLAAAQLFGRDAEAGVDEPTGGGSDGGGVPHQSWGGRRTLLVGTGAYAGAALAALRARGARDIAVWSASGRAESFAASHDVAVAPADLDAALAAADLVVTCRGTGSPVLGASAVAGAVENRAGAPLVVVDLALHRDVAPEVAELPGVLLVDLEAVREHVPAATAADVVRAREIVADGVRALAETTAERRMDSAVVTLRSRVADVVADELDKLPADGEIPTERAAQALRRLAARLVHEPTVLAREAGRAGRAEEHLRALEQVLGLPVTDTAHDGPETSGPMDAAPTAAETERAERTR
ncbi:glutamyl-tRNA reductase [Georgenia deserti]|uniref:Glutamyl-tRNA reductase n=1 Tax=Georgenia deserti TaxID=2093781 RepID=A0ABW4L7P0_9MICO